MKWKVGSVLCVAAGLALAQAPAAGPSFEVASIKPAEPVNLEAIRSGKMPRLGMKVDGAQVSFLGLGIQALLTEAFDVKPYQISGPDWMQTERFDIIAKLPDGATEDQVPAMLEALLVDRFKLTFHKENREHPVYALEVAKGGPKLKEAAPDADAAPKADAESGRGGITIGAGPRGEQMTITPQGRGGGAVVSSRQFGTMKVSPGQDGTMHLEASKVTMASFTDLLGGFADRPVVDQTGLKGAYEISLDVSFTELISAARARGALTGMPIVQGPPIPIAGPGGVPGGPVASDPSGGGSLAEALQKLGLKMEPRKLPVETIVIDHLEKTPTDN
jgi:uncharacterized protein (TIGR03435 family)